ncbi:MAG: SIS domain-containing protein [Gemmatimonadaceae bacterium]
MKESFGRHFRQHQQVVQASLAALATEAGAAAEAIVSALRAGNMVICFGNGGSSTQASHMAEELVGRYKKTRRPFPAISLSSDGGTVTCISNDFGYETLFERQVEAFARPGDIALALTTSGKSKNVTRALRAAKLKGAITIALTGEAGLADAEADHVLAVPSADGEHIQEVHLMLLHFWCSAVDAELGGL